MAQKYKRRKAIEIYFVLYLSALVLILPGKKADDKEPNGAVDLSLFTIQSEKQELACKFVLDSAGVKVLSCDSINVISYAGSVESVRYEFIIEDKNTNEKFRLSNDSKSDLEQYSLEDYPSKHQAIFKWRPRLQLKQNKSYIVKVTAFAKLKDHSQSENTQPIIAKTQFSLQMQYQGDFADFIGSGGGSQQNSYNQGNLPLYNPIYALTNAEFSIEPRNKVIQTLPSQKWENNIIVFGANPQTDFLEPPKIKLSRMSEKTGGTAELAGYNERGIILRGMAPEAGELKVTISATRKRDNKEMTVDFKVKAQKIAHAEFDTLMIAGESYYVNPNLPFLGAQETKAFIKDENKVYSSSLDGAGINFLPDRSLIGRTLYFERYFGDRLIDRTPIRIINYPAPEIFQFYREGSKAIAKIRTWKKTQGRKNFSNIEIVDGNAVAQDLFGKTQENDKYIIQTFEFILNEKTKISIRAIDQIGGKSELKKLN